MTEPKSSPLEKLLSQISGRWTIYILWTLDISGALRFGELRHKVDGISTKVLTERLRMLEAIDIVHRDYEPTIPPQVTYKLTERGKELSGALDHLCDVASRWYGIED
jgi:DNA-binding HxlR family transcriptional regulator